MTNNAPIVVGVDGSGSSFDAVRWAARAAELRGAPLKLVSAYQNTNVYTTLIAIPPNIGSEMKAATTKILEAASEIASTTVDDPATLSVTAEAIVGPAIPVLLERASTARMLVVGSRGNGEYFAELLGSVSAGVSTHAHCPVAIVRGVPVSGSLSGPVVVGVDGSEQNEIAIGVAFEEASLRGAELVAVHAWADHVLLRQFPDDTDEPVDVPALVAAGQTILAESLAGWQERYPEVKVERIVVRDSAVSKLLELSKGAQEVVVGSRGRGGFSGLMLGSTSRSLSHLVDCPMIIAREPSA
ncbi:hypothetical protein A2J03_28665 [Rhodococcus sp. EPR-157]|uniref:universal stress protein n=1 Tax=Rhodococcus sp. EPR-157 TaxID=1813677 RepID=UPI0007BB33AC|nr:universal stress protein [Rhodococcus sp. EPR-157]KZF02489.1 hypothetical protein A2J03_28665 [Rhodococcus sp. EPR-157]